jgi:uncharacterized membrane protein
MTDDHAGRRATAAWGVTLWALGFLALLAALPLAALHRLPDRLATHWDAGSGEPDGSMPLWAASLFPALIWGVTATIVLLTWRARVTSNGALLNAARRAAHQQKRLPGDFIDPPADHSG